MNMSQPVLFSIVILQVIWSKSATAISAKFSISEDDQIVLPGNTMRLQYNVYGTIILLTK